MEVQVLNWKREEIIDSRKLETIYLSRRTGKVLITTSTITNLKKRWKISWIWCLMLCHSVRKMQVFLKVGNRHWNPYKNEVTKRIEMWSCTIRIKYSMTRVQQFLIHHIIMSWKFCPLRRSNTIWSTFLGALQNRELEFQICNTNIHMERLQWLKREIQNTEWGLRILNNNISLILMNRMVNLKAFHWVSRGMNKVEGMNKAIQETQLSNMREQSIFKVIASQPLMV